MDGPVLYHSRLHLSPAQGSSPRSPRGKLRSLRPYDPANTSNAPFDAECVPGYQLSVHAWPPYWAPTTHAPPLNRPTSRLISVTTPARPLINAHPIAATHAASLTPILRDYIRRSPPRTHPNAARTRITTAPLSLPSRKTTFAQPNANPRPSDTLTSAQAIPRFGMCEYTTAHP